MTNSFKIYRIFLKKLFQLENNFSEYRRRKKPVFSVLKTAKLWKIVNLNMKIIK